MTAPATRIGGTGRGKDASPVLGGHLVRYGTAADQKYLLGEFVSTYDQLVINARMVAHMPAALASFLLKRARNKPYMIDPETHAFQHPRVYLESSAASKAGQVKRSIRSLARHYGDPIARKVLNETDPAPVVPHDFAIDDERYQFCQRVLQFQRDSIATEAAETSAAKYYRFLARKEGIPEQRFAPNILIAPYFYMSATTVDAWLDINRACLIDARSIVDKWGGQLAAQVVVDRDVLLSADLTREIVKAYSESASPDAFLLWVDDFAESKAGAEGLHALARFMKQLGAIAPVINLYGGYFSVALLRGRLVRNLVGVTHGLEYGEHRSVVPVGGGVPVSKFYFPALHSRLVFRAALRAAGLLQGLTSPEAYFRVVCDCPECERLIRGDPAEDFLVYGMTKTLPPKGRRTRALEFPTPETKDHCVRHYMFVKNREFTEPFDIARVVASLRDAGAILQNALEPELWSHTSAWARVLAELANLSPEGERCATEC